MQTDKPLSAVASYRWMAYNNAWANHRLLKACAFLTQDEFIAPRIGFFPSIRATLNHILVIDRFYIDAMEGGTLGPAAWAEPQPCSDVLALSQAQAQMDRRLVTIVERLDDAALERSVAIHREARVQHESMARLLLHLFQHQIHHRGQAHSMLSSTSVSPPQLDEFFPAEDAPLRITDLDALGWKEHEIWGGRPPR